MPRRQPTSESPRDCLLRLLRDADVRTPATLANWLLHHLSETQKDQWESYRNELLKSDHIEHVHDEHLKPSNKDYFIVLMHQHNWFKSECERLQKKIDRDLDEKYEGAFGLVLQRAMTTEEHETARLDAQVKQRQTEFRQRKQRQETVQRLADIKREMKLLRSRKPAKPFPVNWCRPMPVTSVQEPLGYCQATAQHERKVLDFLGEKKLLTKQAEPLKRPGRGAPLRRYLVETNLHVLDVWLSEWLPQEPDCVGKAILDTVHWQATQEGDRKDVDRFRKLLLKHWSPIKTKLTNPENIADASRADKALRDSAEWEKLVALVKGEVFYWEKLYQFSKESGVPVSDWHKVFQRFHDLRRTDPKAYQNCLTHLSNLPNPA